MKKSGGALAGRTALVTGAAKRIGRAIALALAGAGANVIVNYNSSKREAEEVADEIRSLGVQSLALRADVARPREVEKMFGKVRQAFGRLDVLVNNAGVFFPARWDRLTESDWDRVLGANLKGQFFCAQAAARLMASRRLGHIINLSSLGGLQPWPLYMHYCASKAGSIMLTKCLARALAPGILVNTIAPGTILFPGEERDPGMKAIVRVTPLKKGGSDADIADVALFLATKNRFITGQVFVVDGGKSLA